jgi:hypothetical protein
LVRHQPVEKKVLSFILFCLLLLGFGSLATNGLALGEGGDFQHKC